MHKLTLFAILFLAVSLACLGSAPRQSSSAEERLDPVNTTAGGTTILRSSPSASGPSA